MPFSKQKIWSFGIFSSSRAWWMFKSYGHKKVSILDGGLKKWKLDKLPIEKGNPKPVLKQGVANTQTTDSLDVNNIRYYKIPVTYEIKGNFLGYIKFKRALAKSKKMLNFDKELISLVQNDSTGGIVAKGELTIVGLPNEFY